MLCSIVNKTFVPQSVVGCGSWWWINPCSTLSSLAALGRPDTPLTDTVRGLNYRAENHRLWLRSLCNCRRMPVAVSEHLRHAYLLQLESSFRRRFVSIRDWKSGTATANCETSHVWRTIYHFRPGGYVFHRVS